MKRNLINGTFSLDQRDARIFEAMISNLNSFLSDADKKSQKNPASIGVKKTYIALSMVDAEESFPSTKISFPDQAIEFPEPHMGSNL